MDIETQFRMSEWAAEGRPGVPFFHVPGVDPALGDGACVSCGTEPREVGLRCGRCIDAVLLVLAESKGA